jgi:senataxin
MELPELDNLYYTICNWNYFRDLTENEVIYKNLEDDRVYEDVFGGALEKVPIRFTNSEEYIRIFSNLFMFESKAQITRSKQVELDRSEMFQLTNCRKGGQFYIFELTRQKSYAVSYSTNDLICISKLPPDSEHNEHLLGVVERFYLNVLVVKVLLIDEKRGQAVKNAAIKNSEWYGTRICNLATINREYQALLSIDSLKLSDTLIQPGGLMELNNQNDFFNIPKRLDLQLKNFFNSSQIDALKSSIKKKGITLIQGPPGTGKTTAILGILSVILNSSVKKEPQHRKDSIIMSLSKEFSFTDHKSGNAEQYAKQHPWLHEDCYENWMDEPIRMDEGFEEYPTSKQTDSHKVLNKPIDDDVSPPEKILVCAPSNVAIDEIVRKIMTVGLIDSEGEKYKPNFIRIGPNFHPSVKEVSLDYIIQERLGKEDTKDYDKIKTEIMGNVKIICSTLSMAGSNILTNLNQKFDTVLIDEAAQAVEISTLIPLKYLCERLILVGDPKQLSATVFSRTAMKQGYDQSLFKRLQEAGHEVTILKTQYRMHKVISKFISDTFYGGLLDDDMNIAETTTGEKHQDSPAFQPLTFYDVESEESFVNNSYYNEAQVIVIIELINKLLDIYTPEEIVERLAIISPYSLQVSTIKERIKYIPGFEEIPIEVNTVDGFQGREKSMILFSTVRSKGSKTIGFLSEERRMNVGLSRAKSCLVVVGDSRKLINDNNWDKLVRYAFRNATFYKIKGSIKDYFSKFDDDYQKYLVKDEETFVKMIFNK